MLGMCTSVREKFFRNQILLDCLGWWRNQSCQIFFQPVHSNVFGKGSNFAIFSVNHGWPLQLLYYRTTVMSKNKFWTKVHTAENAIFWLYLTSWCFKLKTDHCVGVRKGIPPPKTCSIFPRDRQLPYGDWTGFSRNGSVTMTKREVPKCC